MDIKSDVLAIIDDLFMDVAFLINSILLSYLFLDSFSAERTASEII